MGAEVGAVEVLGGHAGSDAHLDEEVEGICHLLDEVGLHCELSLLLPRLELELLHRLAEFTNEVAEELMDSGLDSAVVEVTLFFPSDDWRSVDALDVVVLGHEVALTLEDHLEVVDLGQLSRQTGALLGGRLGGLSGNRKTDAGFGGGCHSSGPFHRADERPSRRCHQAGLWCSCTAGS